MSIKYKVGEIYGSLQIDEEHAAGDGRSYKNYVYHCVKCGHAFRGAGGTITGMVKNGCTSCKRIERAKIKCQEYGKYLGQHFGALEVVSLCGTEKYGKHKMFFVECKCEKCGSIKKYPLHRLISNSSPVQCIDCSRSIAAKNVKTYREGMSINGTKASSLVKRKNGLTNKNNSSGCNGVSRSGEKWRAYITLKRNQIHLGTFDSFEDAVDARKEAEKRLYDPEIQAFVEAKPEWEKSIRKMSRLIKMSRKKENNERGW